jgi:adenylate kinase family enzyme
MPEMKRVVVVGSSGSGKTTLARNIHQLADLPFLEMDAVMHERGWNATPNDEFLARLSEFARQDRWVIDGNYTSHGVSEEIWPLADTFVWSDPPKAVLMRRVVGRTLRRVVTREKLWAGGLREPLANLYKTDPYENIIVWAWTRYDHVRSRYEKAIVDGSWDHAVVHRLRSASDVHLFLDGLADAWGPPSSGGRSRLNRN